MADVPLSEHQLFVLLEKRYSGGGYAVLPQVRNSTGYARTIRTADALVMSLWPSRGLELMGFEMKSLRSDWLHELNNPAKADEIGKSCDRWWLVAGREDIVVPAELPKAWGLMVPRGDKLVVVVEAPLMKAKPLSRSFLAAILRKAVEFSLNDEAVTEKVHTAVAAALEAEKFDRERVLTNLRRDYDELRAAVNAFQAASGVSINKWDAPQVGKAVQAVLNAETRGVSLNELKRQEREARRTADWIAERVAELEEFIKATEVKSEHDGGTAG